MKLYLFIRIIIIYGYECLVPVSFISALRPDTSFTLLSSVSIPWQILHDIMRYYLYFTAFCRPSQFKFSLMYISLWLECGLDNFQFLAFFFVCWTKEFHVRVAQDRLSWLSNLCAKYLWYKLAFWAE